MSRKLKFIVFIVLVAVAFYGVSSWLKSREDESRLLEQTSLLQKQIEHTSKLVVTEIQYAKVFSYENTRQFGWDYWDVFGVPKRALIISEAKAQISYDLRQLKYDLDPENKTIYLTQLPPPEISINPDIRFYDVKDYPLNKFSARDYNKIKKGITEKIRKEVLADPEMNNAQNRLLSELSNIYILSKSMGWTLVYEGENVNSTKELKSFLD